MTRTAAATAGAWRTTAGHKGLIRPRAEPGRKVQADTEQGRNGHASDVQHGDGVYRGGSILVLQVESATGHNG